MIWSSEHQEHHLFLPPAVFYWPESLFGLHHWFTAPVHFISITELFFFFFFACETLPKNMRHLPSHRLWIDFAPELAAYSCAASQSHCGQFGRRRVEGGQWRRYGSLITPICCCLLWCIANIVVWLPIDFSSRCSQLCVLCVCVCVHMYV